MKKADVEDGRRPGLSEDRASSCVKRRSGSGCSSRRTRSCAGRPPTCPRRTCREIVFPLVREMAATGARVRVPVAVACRVLGLSTQGYYKWLKAPVSQRDWDDAHLIDVLFDLHADDATLGYRFLTDELADAGIEARNIESIHSHDAVARVRGRTWLKPYVIRGQLTGQLSGIDKKSTHDRRSTRQGTAITAHLERVANGPV